MPRLRNTFDDVWATLMMFTRLPFWRLHQPSTDHFRNVASYWPLAGWLTGGAMALTFYYSIMVLPLSVATLLTIGVRILLTGALHEDGLADFCDGMGGGTTPQRILQIMKDSHIGTYGVLGLVLYLAFLYFGIQEMATRCLKESLTQGCTCRNPVLMISTALLTMDVWGKSIAALIVRQLPYARTAEEAKTHLVYRTNPLAQPLATVVALLPIAALWLYLDYMPFGPSSIYIPIILEMLMAAWMKKRIGGYTGDCCGALFLITEASILLTFLL